jgi:hypothetical protein
MTPKVSFSIIIPVFNAGNFIEKCLLSILYEYLYLIKAYETVSQKTFSKKLFTHQFKELFSKLTTLFETYN